MLAGKKNASSFHAGKSGQRFAERLPLKMRVSVVLIARVPSEFHTEFLWDTGVRHQ